MKNKGKRIYHYQYIPQFKWNYNYAFKYIAPLLENHLFDLILENVKTEVMSFISDTRDKMIPKYYHTK